MKITTNNILSRTNYLMSQKKSTKSSSDNCIRVYIVIRSDQEKASDTEAIGTFSTIKKAEDKIISILKEQFDDAMLDKTNYHIMIVSFEKCGDDEERFGEIDLETEFTWENVLKIIKKELDEGEVDDLQYCDRYSINTNYVE